MVWKTFRNHQAKKSSFSCGVSKISPDGILTSVRSQVQRDVQTLPARGDALIEAMLHLSQDERGFILITVFLLDLMGSNTLCGRLFYHFIIQPRLKSSNTATKLFITLAILLGNVVVLGMAAYLVAFNKTDFMTWIDSWMQCSFLALSIEIVILSRNRVFLLDCLLPSAIHEDVSFTMIQLYEHTDRVISTISRVAVDMYMNLFSASNFLYLSEYIASQFQMNRIACSPIVKFIVLSYKDVRPKRSSFLWHEKLLQSGMHSKIFPTSEIAGSKFVQPKNLT